MSGTGLRQDGVDRAFGFDQAGRVSGANIKHDPATVRAYCLRRLNEARLAVSGIEDEVDAPAAGQPRDFGSDIVALVVKDVMRARLSGQRYRLRRAATADDESCPEDARGHLHGEMPDPAAAARDVDRVTGSDSAAETREGRKEAHWQRRPTEEAQGYWLGDGQKLPRERIAAFAPTPGDPAAVPI